jgi:oxygen-independent coproporphyrinogen-3 oxidase
MDAALIRLVENARLPRYTSYPTAPHFSAAVGADAHAAWLRGVSLEEPVSLYLHVPYCRDLCWYCGCTTHALGRKERAVAYADLLLRELALVAAHLPGRPPVSHLHWGGGTPSVLGADLLRIMARLREAFAFRPDAELAIELDPRDVDPAFTAELAGAGFRRASLGVQSFDPQVQRAIHREQSVAVTRAAADALRAAGITAINIDLLYGLPFQTTANAEATAEEVVRLEPARVAVFGYAHLPTLRPMQRLIPDAALPDAAARWRQSEAIRAVLEGAGFVAIGLDHYARPDDTMAQAARAGRLRRNFQGYTTDTATTLLGLGASAISAFPDGYAQNEPRLPQWRASVLAERLPTARGLRLTAEDRARRTVIETIMCRGEIDLGAVAQEAELVRPDLHRLDELEALGVIERAGPRIAMRPGCWPLLRLLAAAFDAYLDRSVVRHAPAV